MNISFIAIIFLWIVIAIFLKNLFNLDLRGFRKYVWAIIAIAYLVFQPHFLINSGAAGSFIHFLYLDLPVQFLLGPCVYFLLKFRPRKVFVLRRKDYLHFVPSMISFMILISIYGLSGREKLLLIENIPTSVEVLTWILLGQMITYLLVLLWVMNIHQFKKISWSDNRWIPLLGFGICLVITFMDIISSDISIQLRLLNAIQLVILVYWYKRANSRKRKPKPESSNNELVRIIEETMETDKLFLDQKLSLSMLAQHLNENTNSISKVLNNELSTNFNEYINTYRVNEVLRLMNSDENKKYTLEAISTMAGFGSLTTFNAAFKKQTGKTPREYSTLTEL